MNVYIRMVIASREYHAKLLLGVLAAARGHRVLVGELPKLARRLPPGIYHTNDLHARKAPQLEKLSLAGFVITAHDEEHGLNDHTFENTLQSRFSNETVSCIAASFSWGSWDNQALRESFPDHSASFLLTGSPRVDLWRSDRSISRAISRPESESRKLSNRKQILIASNFGPQPTPSWKFYGASRGRELGLSLEDRLAGLRTTESITGITSSFVAAVHLLARALPDVDILVRPHPTEAWGALAELIGPLPNVIVNRAGTISQAIQDSNVLIHSGSTSGIEAAVAGTPAIAFVPDSYGAGWFSNSLGQRAESLTELLALTRRALDNDQALNWYSSAEREQLAERIHVPGDRLSSEIVVDKWESLMSAHELSAAAPMRAPQLRKEALSAELRERRTRTKASVRLMARRTDARGSEIAEVARDESVRFPPFESRALRRDVAAIARALALPEVRVRQVGARLAFLQPA
jgi:surface carbohydrate biosynthesis protein